MRQHSKSSFSSRPSLASSALALRSLLVLSLAGACLFYGLEHVWHFTIDDAGISYAYAKHLARGQGLVAVVGGPTIEGYSNFLWVLLLAPLAWFDAMLEGAKLVSCGLLVASVLLGMALSARLDDRPAWQLSWSDLVVPVLLGLTPQFIVWVPSGLENVLMALLVVLLAALDYRDLKHPARWPWATVPAFLLCLTRPEGVLYAAGFGLIKLLHAGFRREHLRQTLQYAALMFGLLLLFYLWRYWTFGDWVPNTYYAKPHVQDALAEGLDYIEKHAGKKEPLLFWVAPLAALGLLRHFRVKLTLLSSLLAAIAFVLYAGGDWMPHGRFLSFAVAPFAVLTACGIANLNWLVTHPLRRRLSRRWVLAPQWLALLLVLPASQQWFEYQKKPLKKIERRKWCHLCERISDVSGLIKLQERLEIPSATLVTHDFGGPAWLSSERLYPLDILGLCDHAIGQAWALRSEERFREFDWIRYQYSFHEQGRFPTFVYFPAHFWKGFRDSAEWDWGYFPLSGRHLGPKRRRDAVFGIHRRLFIDYFPEVGRFEFRQLDKQLTLLGSAVEGVAEPKSHMTVRATLLAKTGSTNNVWLALRWKGHEQATDRQRLFPKRLGLPSRWTPGEPRELEWRVKLPAELKAVQGLELGVHRRGKWQWHELTSVMRGAEYVPLNNSMTFPQHLPVAQDARLIELEQRVHRVLEARFGEKGQAHGDPRLAEELEDYAGQLLEAGHDEQAYLASVLATQAHRDTWQALHQQIQKLRPLWSNHAFVRELSLLRHAYTQGNPTWFMRLAAEYASQHSWHQAAYFAGVVPPPSEAREAYAALLEAIDQQKPELVPKRWLQQPLPGSVSDFEAPKLEGWKTEGILQQALYSVPHEKKPALRGFQGQQVLSTLASKKPRKTRIGKVSSAPFVVDAKTLSFMLAGSRSAGTVQLVIDGKKVATAKPHGSDFFHYHFFDLAEYQGKRAQIVIQARTSSRRRYLAVDDFGLWR